MTDEPAAHPCVRRDDERPKFAAMIAAATTTIHEAWTEKAVSGAPVYVFAQFANLDEDGRLIVAVGFDASPCDRAGEPLTAERFLLLRHPERDHNRWNYLFPERIERGLRTACHNLPILQREFPA